MRILNIFTDASITHGLEGPTYGCAGIVCVENNATAPIYEAYNTLYNTTNNESEAWGVYMAVMYIMMHHQEYDRINVISDSQWCIRSITRWIFDWIHHVDEQGNLLNSYGQPVANQKILCWIIKSIIDYRVHVHFYHCKGHVTSTNASIFEALKTFRESNSLPRDMHLNYDFIRWLAYYNNMVDRNSRACLDNLAGSALIDISTFPFISRITFEEIEIYKTLIAQTTIEFSDECFIFTS